MDTEKLDGLVQSVSDVAGWLHDNWFTLVLSAEIIGAIIAVKVGKYRKGFVYLGAALATIWIGMS